MKEYDLYVPSHYNDGRIIERERIDLLKRRLTDQFGGLTHFPQENEGFWKVGRVTFRDKIMILRVLSAEAEKANAFFIELKQHLQKEWEQEDVLIVSREVEAL